MRAKTSPPPAEKPPAPPPPVVLVHGIFRNHRQMRWLGAALHATGRRTFAPDLRPNDGSVSLSFLAAQLGAYLERQLAAGERCDLVAHSMGGVVARAYVQRHGGRARVRRLVTLAAPHHGSLLAWLWPGRGARELRPGSAFLRDLASDVDQLDGLHVASVWTPFDLVIVPPRSSMLSVGRNLSLPLPHHRALVTHRRVAKLVVNLLDAEG